MDRQELHNLRKWFSEYCRSFYTPVPEDQKNIVLKEEHTRCVCENMAEIGRHLGLDPGRAALAEAIALFHDVGRFPQYHLYKTFRDDLSTNHAALGAGVLVKENVLRNLPRNERDLVVHAVTLHNTLAVPEGLDEESLLFLRMVRDADKLDIWRVFIDYYAQRNEDRASAAALGLPDTPEYSAETLASIRKRELVLLKSLRTLNDFKLLQLAWIFDLNFARSLELVRERSIIDGIANTLPHTEDIALAVNSIRDYVDKKLAAA